MVVERLRGRAGQRQRQRRLARTKGLCEHCQAVGRTTIATVVNHIIPLIQGGSDEDSNTENLCAECDRVATALQFEHHVALGARGVAVSGRPSSPDHAWNRSTGATAGPPPGGSKVQGGQRRTPHRPSIRCESKSKHKS